VFVVLSPAVRIKRLFFGSRDVLFTILSMILPYKPGIGGFMATSVARPSMLHIVHRLLSIKPYSPYEMQRLILLNYDRQISDAGLTARIRELRGQGYEIKASPRKGTSTWQYQLQ
jgi:hypothetical protein